MTLSIGYKISKLRTWLRSKLNRKESFHQDLDLTLLNELQAKVFQLWKMYLKDKSISRFYYNPETTERQIDKSSVMMKLDSYQDFYKVSVIDTTCKNCYEVTLPVPFGRDLADEFDVEVNRRMRGAEYEKKQIIKADLEKLIRIEEASNPNKYIRTAV